MYGRWIYLTNNGRLKKWETCLKTVILSVCLVPIVMELQQHTKPHCDCWKSTKSSTVINPPDLNPDLKNYYLQTLDARSSIDCIEVMALDLISKAPDATNKLRTIRPYNREHIQGNKTTKQSSRLDTTGWGHVDDNQGYVLDDVMQVMTSFISKNSETFCTFISLCTR